MSGRDTRPVRTQAAWGYDSAAEDTRVEIDVFTVNIAEAERDDAVERAREAFDGRVQVAEAFGNVARVNYAGAAGGGYRYIDMAKTNPGKEKPSDATQQAFAGAKRVAGGDQDDEGRIVEGFETPPDAPGIDEAIAYGEGYVIPAVVSDLRENHAPELADEVASIGRDESRDEIEEPTNTRPFDGFDNAVRIYPRSGREFEYSVDVNKETLR
jgi:hypothetical protein